MSERESLIIRILKKLGIITTHEVSKEYMCKKAQSMCNHECDSCAWNEVEE